MPGAHLTYAVISGQYYVSSGSSGYSPAP